MVPFRFKAAVITFQLLVVVPPCAAAETISVPGDFTEIQDALDAARDGDTVLLAPGEYVISASLCPSRAGEPGKDILILGGGEPEETVIRMSGQPSDPDRGSVLVFENEETHATRVESLTLTGGNSRLGGGVFADGASPTFVECRIEGNRASFGGGLATAGGAPLVLDSVIQGNWAAAQGGGVAVFTREALVVRNSRIERNYGFTGGGIYAPPDSEARFEGSRIAENAAFEGGGIYCWGDRSVLIGTEFTGNWSQEGGGGAWVLDGSSTVFDGCTFIGNMASFHGGAVAFSRKVSAVLRNCVIVGNTPGIYSREGAEPTIVNCTLTRNFGRPLYCESGASPRVLNTIVWGNYYSDEPCGELVSSPVGEDPHFVLQGEFSLHGAKTIEIGGVTMVMPDMIVEAGDYRLQLNSPALDAGRLEGAPPTDRDGNGRPCGAGVDLGAYEGGACPLPDGPMFRRGDANANEVIDLIDSVFVLNFLFLGGDQPECLSAADTNDSGFLDVSDPVHLLNHLFLGGAAPEPPYRQCGLNPTFDGLSCEAYAPCNK